MGDTAPEYWFCLKHRAVEGTSGCRNADRLGPYSSAEEAEQALEKVEARNESWENDPAWNDDDEWPDADETGSESADPAS